MRFRQVIPIRRHLLKVISLFAAFMLWFYVLSNEPFVIEKKIKLDFEVPKGYAISNLPKREVTVKIRGSRIFMKNLLGNEAKILLDLKIYPYKKTKNFDVHINPYDVPVSFGLDVIKVTPDKINVTLDKSIYKKVPVKVKLSGEVTSEMKLVKYGLIPSEVMIVGPIEVMRKVSFMNTESIDLSPLDGTGIMKVRIDEVDPRIRVKEEELSEVDFSYVVKPKKANMTLKKIKIRFLSTRRNFYTKNKYVSLDVLVAEEVKHQINRSKIQVVADIPEGKKGVMKIKLKAILPDGVHLLRINPENIVVKMD